MKIHEEEKNIVHLHGQNEKYFELYFIYKITTQRKCEQTHRNRKTKKLEVIGLFCSFHETSLMLLCSSICNFMFTS